MSMLPLQYTTDGLILLLDKVGKQLQALKEEQENRPCKDPSKADPFGEEHSDVPSVPVEEAARERNKLQLYKEQLKSEELNIRRALKINEMQTKIMNIKIGVQNEILNKAIKDVGHE